MKIAIGSDHRGYQLKQLIIGFLKQSGIVVEDFGAYSEDSADYPDFARSVGKAVTENGYDFGILLCGTGIGMCIAANKVHGVRGAVARDTFEAQRMRQHNSANVLCLSAGNTDIEEAKNIIKVFLNTSFEGGRHQRRLDKIADMESAA